MMRKIVDGGHLKDGRPVEIELFRPDGTACSRDFLRGFFASFVLNNGKPGAGPGYWLADLHARFAGEYRNGCSPAAPHTEENGILFLNL